MRRAIDQWPVVIQNIYPTYIGWERFLANQARLRENQSRYREDHKGVARKGQALLQGILRCGYCGNAASTTAAERKEILRCVSKHVVVDQKRSWGQVWYKIVWQTGAISEHCYTRRVRSYREHATGCCTTATC